MLVDDFAESVIVHVGDLAIGTATPIRNITCVVGVSREQCGHRWLIQTLMSDWDNISKQSP